MRKTLNQFSFALGLCAALVAPALAADSQLESFFRRHLEERFLIHPFEATQLGDHRFDDRLDRPEKADTRYRPVLIEAAYWLLTIGTASRVLGELLHAATNAAWIRWVVVAAGVMQIVAMVLFFHTMWSRIRAVGSQVREAKGERF